MPSGIYKHPIQCGFKKGYMPWNKGKKLSKEHINKLKIARKKHRSGMLGKYHSEETKRKMSESHKNSKVFQEVIHSKKRSEKISKALIGKPCLRRGDKSNFWKGGVSYEPYGVNWTTTLKRSVRERDKYICKLCGNIQGDIAHDVHHIDYDKKNCNPNNLITLCHNCHIKTNQNRNYYIDYFSRIIMIE